MLNNGAKDYPLLPHSFQAPSLRVLCTRSFSSQRVSTNQNEHLPTQESSPSTFPCPALQKETQVDTNEISPKFHHGKYRGFLSLNISGTGATLSSRVLLILGIAPCPAVRVLEELVKGRRLEERRTPANEMIDFHKDGLVFLSEAHQGERGWN